jgi:hypothetical protein
MRYTAILLIIGVLIRCPSVFGQKAMHVSITALKKRDIKDFRQDIHPKSGIFPL